MSLKLWSLFLNYRYCVLILIISNKWVRTSTHWLQWTFINLKFSFLQKNTINHFLNSAPELLKKHWIEPLQIHGRWLLWQDAASQSISTILSIDPLALFPSHCTTSRQVKANYQKPTSDITQRNLIMTYPN